ncbi:biotin-dependent carboxyltransferase family protein [Nakamurella sp. YIM 132084]|uniref:Biotin-dependent carboxyltransferase family protein n=1 Tax=Nakamurella leprariae TaxID=2803911 RepID=A0A939C2J0_9ACTN|nr:biotin-dependent carboxyltransferase family protein [Nakamurella leprariae]
MITVLRAGPLTTVQDAGRTGHTAVGVSTSGAADLPSYRLAVRLVGAPAGTAALEITLGGLVAVLDADRWVAVTGAPAPLTVAGRPVTGPLVRVPAGAPLAVGTPAVGLRSYLAVGGGLLVRPVLGSRSTDTLAGLGPPPVADGLHIPIGPDGPPADDADLAVSRVPADAATARFRWGPRDDRFSAADRAALVGTTWTVSPDSNRVGARLTGARLRSAAGTLPSEGTVAGSLQVPPSGEPIVFLADHPVTGGYPVIGVLTDPDLALLAQCRPGTSVRLLPVA